MPDNNNEVEKQFEIPDLNYEETLTEGDIRDLIRLKDHPGWEALKIFLKRKQVGFNHALIMRAEDNENMTEDELRGAIKFIGSLENQIDTLIEQTIDSDSE